MLRLHLTIIVYHGHSGSGRGIMYIFIFNKHTTRNTVTTRGTRCEVYVTAFTYDVLEYGRALARSRTVRGDEASSQHRLTPVRFDYIPKRQNQLSHSFSFSLSHRVPPNEPVTSRSRSKLLYLSPSN